MLLPVKSKRSELIEVLQSHENDALAEHGATEIESAELREQQMVLLAGERGIGFNCQHTLSSPYQLKELVASQQPFASQEDLFVERMEAERNKFDSVHYMCARQLGLGFLSSFR